MPTTEDELPDAYLRLLRAQRSVDPYEREEMQRETDRESRENRIRRRYPKVY
jgi:hypothetical protein